MDPLYTCSLPFGLYRMNLQIQAHRSQEKRAVESVSFFVHAPLLV